MKDAGECQTQANPSDLLACDAGAGRSLRTPTYEQLDEMASLLRYDRPKRLVLQYLDTVPADRFDKRALSVLSVGIFDEHNADGDIEAVIQEVTEHCAKNLAWDPLASCLTSQRQSFRSQED